MRKIRITQKDKIEYTKLRTNARRKLTRLQKNHGVDLTNEIPLKSLDEFETRAEYNKWKNQMKSFTNRFNLNYQFRTNKYNVTKSVKEIQEMNRLRNREIRKAKEKVKDIENKTLIQKGKEYGKVKEKSRYMGEPETTKIHVPKKLDFDKVQSNRKWEEMEEIAKKRISGEHYETRNQRMLDNFIKALEGSFHGEEEDLVKKLKEVGADDFYEMWLRIEEFSFENYDSEGEHIAANTKSIDTMMEYLNDWEKGKYKEQTDDLRNF